MTPKPEHVIDSAELVLACADLDKTITLFTGDLQFRLDSIFPADDPAVAVVSGHGLRVRLERGPEDLTANEKIRFRLNCSLPDSAAGGHRELIAPNGVRIEFAAPDQKLIQPEPTPAFVLNKFSGDTDWTKGCAGMHYRDLIPGRQGGRFIASHIRVPDAGPVPDYVHFHNVQLQLIYCYKGWARLVYEDQGAPFILNAGDCVLQPPGIRHRVLESSAGLEVIEISSPAEHVTFSDHRIDLPTASLEPDRDFGGQRFVRSIASERCAMNWRLPGFESHDTGIGVATCGLAGVRTVNPVSGPPSSLCGHDAEFVFFFILCGKADLHCEQKGSASLDAGDSFVIPAGLRYGFANCSEDLEMLEVTMPEDFETEFPANRTIL